MPMTTFSPAPAPVLSPVGPPSCSQRPPGAVSPRKAGVDDVSAVTVSSSVTARTLACFSRAAFCASVSFAAKPLNVYL